MPETLQNKNIGLLHNCSLQRTEQREAQTAQKSKTHSSPSSKPIHLTVTGKQFSVRSFLNVRWFYDSTISRNEALLMVYVTRIFMLISLNWTGTGRDIQMIKHAFCRFFSLWYAPHYCMVYNNDCSTCIYNAL